MEHTCQIPSGLNLGGRGYWAKILYLWSQAEYIVPKMSTFWAVSSTVIWLRISGCVWDIEEVSNAFLEIPFKNIDHLRVSSRNYHSHCFLADEHSQGSSGVPSGKGGRKFKIGARRICALVAWLWAAAIPWMLTTEKIHPLG